MGLSAHAIYLPVCVCSSRYIVYPRQFAAHYGVYGGRTSFNEVEAAHILGRLCKCVAAYTRAMGRRPVEREEMDGDLAIVSVSSPPVVGQDASSDSVMKEAVPSYDTTSSFDPSGETAALLPAAAAAPDAMVADSTATATATAIATAIEGEPTATTSSIAVDEYYSTTGAALDGYYSTTGAAVHDYYSTSGGAGEEHYTRSGISADGYGYGYTTTAFEDTAAPTPLAPQIDWLGVSFLDHRHPCYGAIIQLQRWWRVQRALRQAARLVSRFYRRRLPIQSEGRRRNSRAMVLLQLS